MAVGEWDQRQLCPDGSCIGVIGPDGTCKVCGRAAPNWGDERNRGLTSDDASEEREPAWDDSSTFHGKANLDDEDDDDEYEDDEDSDDSEHDDDDVEPATAGPEWSGRELCPDGGCIGVIGPDGTCKVCGKPGTKRPSSGAGPRGGASSSAASSTGASMSGASSGGASSTRASMSGASSGGASGAASSGGTSSGTSSSAASSSGASISGAPMSDTSSGGASSGGASSGGASSTSTDKATEALGSSAAAAAGSSIGGVLADNADDWGDRKLCSDPTCVGVSGLDGRCKVCGKECL